MAGVDGFGTQLKRGATPEVFEVIGNCTAITPPEIERDTYDTTAHDTATRWRTFLGGLVDGGDFATDIHYDPAKHDDLTNDFEDQAPRNYRLVFPDDADTTWSFTGILTGFSREAPHDDLMSGNLTWKVSGKPTWS